MKAIPRLTDLEIKILKVLWDTNEGMTIQEIAEGLKEEKISAPSVSQAVHRLTAKEAVQVSDYVLVVSSYTRKFVPSFSREEFMAEEMNRLTRSIWGKRSLTRGNVAAVLGLFQERQKGEVSEEELRRMRRMIDAYVQGESEEE